MVRVVFIHPDLGIGGAERLVVDAALALKRKGHQVQFFTAHHDPTHCFPETTGQLEVTCVGDWLPRSTFGRLAAFWAYLRMIYVSIYLILFSGVQFDVAFVDQVSVCIPFLRLRGKVKILFYCHFPDQLLTQRKSFVKKFYRFFLDYLEEKTTTQADCVLVNSLFTASVYISTFKSVKNAPSVLYPSLNCETFDRYSSLSLKDAELDIESEYMFLSLNRYEWKKNLPLALEATKLLLDSVPKDKARKIHLVVAGGYDNRVRENIEHYSELVKLAESLGISDHVTFLKSPSDKAKIALLRAAKCLIYTPDKEHFGIVPVEAMYMHTPVIAVNSGGPKESIVNGETGFLCDQNAKDFSDAMMKFVTDENLKETMGNAGHERVVGNFSFIRFSEHLNYIVEGLMDGRKQR